MLPTVVNYSVATGTATTIVNANAATSGPLTLAATATPGPYQMRLLITSAGNDSGLYFDIQGTNQAGFPIGEFLAGSNSTTAQSILDYQGVKSIQPSSSSTAQTLGTTAATVSVGVNGVGSSMWNIVNWHVSPSNISFACRLLGTNNATFSIQYTYDDPNNLSGGATYPQPFNHPSIVNATSTIDGYSNDPITAWRLYVSAGTGSIQATGIQAGIAGPGT